MLSQPMPFPRPRSRVEDLSEHTDHDLPKRIPGATLRSVPGAGRRWPGQTPPLSWHRYPLGPRPGILARLSRALRNALHR